MSLVQLSDRVSKTLMVLAATWAFILCFIILFDVVARGLFNSPIQGTKEIVANSIVMIVFLQAGYAIRSRSMLRADFLVRHFSHRGQQAVLMFGYLLGVLFFLIMLLGGIEPAIRSVVNGEYDGEGALRVPVWPTRFMILIGAGLAIVNYIVLAAVDVLGVSEEGPDTKLEDAGV